MAAVLTNTMDDAAPLHACAYRWRWRWHRAIACATAAMRNARVAAAGLFDICAVAASRCAKAVALCKVRRVCRRFLRNPLITLTAAPPLKAACGLKRLPYRL
ncbi:hypothetical protein [Xanthomonas cannabis]|uniref:hypothetical protein n=1 Tax=Xanthomonas cannabis TaxID=1885674 RepID=UPI001301054C|nr:hypothetical protein [Xanthomonas cannabis]